MRRHLLRRPLAAASAVAVTGALLVVAGPPSQAVGACTKTWDAGAGTTVWSDAANWSPDGEPSGTDTVCIANGATVSATSINVAGLSITNGELAMQGSGTIGAGGLLVDALSTSQYGRLQASPSPGELTVDGPVQITGGQVWRNGGGPAGKIRQGSGFPLVLGSKAVTGGTRIFDAASTIISTLGNAASLSGSASLNGLVLEVPGKVTVAAGTDFAYFNSSSMVVQSIETQGDATIGAALTLQGGTSSLGGSFTARGLTVGSSADVAIPASKTVRVIGGGTIAGAVTGSGTFRKETSDQLFVTKTMNVGTLQNAGGEVRVKSGSSFTAGRVEIVGSTGSAQLIADPNQTMTIGTGGLLLDDGDPTFPGRSGVISGGIVSVAGPIDIAEGTISSTNLTQTGAANNITATPIKGDSGPQFLINDTTVTTAGDVDITGTHQVYNSAITSRRLVLKPGTVLFDTGNPNTTTFNTQGVVTTTPGTAPSVDVTDGVGINVTGSLSDLAGGLTVNGKVQVTGAAARVDVPAGQILSATGGVVVTTGTLSGAGTVSASVLNNGFVAPGTNGVGTLSVTKYTQLTDGRLNIELASDTSSDVLNVTGPDAPSFAGFARILCVGGYIPSGVSFDIVTSATAPAAALAPSAFCNGVNGTTSVVGSAVRLTFPTATTAPGAPGVALTPTVSGLDVLVTPPASDGGSAITGYTVTCTPGCTGGSLTGPAGGTVSLTGLTGGQTYTVSVTATNGVGPSAATTADGVPLSPAATVPGAPGVVVTAKVEALDVAITAPSDDGGSPITGYEITCVPACTSVTNPVAAGTTTLTGLTGGTSYDVTVVAVNGTGPSTPTTVTKAALAPAPTSTVSTTTAVVSTSGSFKVTCSHNRGVVKACGAVLKGSNGTIYGKATTATVPAGAATITVTVKVNSAGITASKKLGGLAGTVVITTTPATDPVTVTTKSIRVTQKTTSKTWKSSSFFTTTGTSLTSAGKTALIAVAKAVQGSKTFKCEVNVARTSSATNDYNRGLKRATAVCAFVKATIKARGWKPIGTYTLKSWGSTKPISLSKAWVKLTAGN